MPRATNIRCRGQSLVEFALSMPLLVLLTIGGFAIGVSLERHLTVAQLARHAGNMYARDVKFDNVNSPARHLMVQAAGAMKLSRTKGDCDSEVKAVVYLTQVQITPDKPPGTFENEGKPVMMHRTLMGNSCLGESKLGTPPSRIWKLNDPVNPGSIKDPFNEPGAVADVPTHVTSELLPGETVFVVEIFHNPEDLLFRGFISPRKLYTRVFF